MIDVLYIHPFGKNPAFIKRYPVIEDESNIAHKFGFLPIGIIGIINNLIKNGISVKGINLPLKERVNPSFDLIKCLEFYKPKIVLLDMHWYVHVKNGIEIAKLSKKIANSKVVVGGLSATIFYKQLLKHKEIDYVVKGDAELPALKLVKAILNKKQINFVENVTSKEFDNKTSYLCKDLDKYDYTTINFLEDYDSYANFFDAWIMTGKGCPYECEMCDGSKKEAKELFCREHTTYRSAKKIIEDLESIKAQTACFSLDLELLSPKVIDKLSKKRFSINLRNEFFQLADINKLRRIKDSFRYFDLVFSPVSGDERERRKYGKNFSNKEFMDMLKKIEEEDINAGVIIYFTDSMISPLSREELNKRAREKLIKEIERIVPYALIRVMSQIVDPGTLIGKMNIEDVFGEYCEERKK